MVIQPTNIILVQSQYSGWKAGTGPGREAPQQCRSTPQLVARYRKGRSILYLYGDITAGFISRLLIVVKETAPI